MERNQLSLLGFLAEIHNVKKVFCELNLQSLGFKRRGDFFPNSVVHGCAGPYEFDFWIVREFSDRKRTSLNHLYEKANNFQNPLARIFFNEPLMFCIFFVFTTYFGHEEKFTIF